MAAADKAQDLQKLHNKGSKIELRLAGYEALAWKVIGGHGYPTTWEEFCEEFDNDSSHPDAVRIAHGVFLHTQAVRDQISRGDIDGAVLEALQLERHAAKLMDVPVGAMYARN